MQTRQTIPEKHEANRRDDARISRLRVSVSPWFVRSPRPPRIRGGVTLVEVLMSVMLMGIGVVTLATLFPLSILRTIQATQLTNATILRHDAEAAIDMWRYTGNDLLQPPPSQGGPTQYVVDPMGAWIVGGQFAGMLPRYSGNTTTQQQAAQLSTLPDSWVEVGQAVPNAAPAAGANSVTLPNVDLSSVAPATATYRVVLFDAAHRLSEVRAVTGRSGQTISFAPALSGSIQYGGPVHVEVQERRYSSMLTVSNFTGVPNVDVVTFFNRSYGPNDETIYGNGGNPVFQASGATPRQATIQFGGNPKPFLKKGSYVFDPAGMHWYRIQNYTVTATSATLTLDQPAVQNSSAAVFMRGIVEVYPLGAK